MDKLTPIGQKGYSKTRRCQEALIEILEGIAECKKRNKKGALLSLDIRKAFDTLSHSFVEKVLDHFNFGENFKKWIKLLCTNREACIVLEGGRLSRRFKLLRGNAQGDILSPFIFLLCYQILIFKLQFDLQIKGFVSSPVEDPATLASHLPAEVRDIPTKVAAMADDASCLVLMDAGTLRTIKSVLSSFGIISGLCCNIEKTALIPIGVVSDIPAEILELGFEIRQSATILGLEIGSGSVNFDVAAGQITDKLKKEVNRWARFNLSLPGRIAVTKSLLYSQLNYLGAILPFSNDSLKEWSNVIEKFVSGNLNIAKNRIYYSPENGGLGLVEIKKFLNYQCCAWINSSLNLDSHWKRVLYCRSLGQILNAKADDFPDSPTLGRLVEALNCLSTNHNLKNENFRVSYIYANDLFKQPTRPSVLFDEAFFNECRSVSNNSNFRSIRFNDIFSGNNLKTSEEITNRTGYAFNQQQLLKLERAGTTTNNRYKKESAEEQKAKHIETVFSRFKKGSKIFKKIILATQYTGSVYTTLY